MAIQIDYDRTKLNTTLASSNDSTLSNPVEGTKVWDLFLRLDNVTIDSQTETGVSGTTGTAVLTKDAGVLGDLREGDLVTGPAGVPVGAYILSIDSETQLTLDSNLTGNVTSEDLDINDAGSKSLNCTYMQVRLSFTEGVDFITFTPTIYLYDGTLTEDPGNTGTDTVDISQASQVITLASQTTPTVRFGIDNFLSNLRVERTNL